jgi:phosphoserine aminotransferase
MNNQVYNFNAGPATLPNTVLEEAQTSLLNYKDSGLSILEISHRSDLFSELLMDAKVRLRRLLKLSDDYQICFCPGGATQQFSMVPLNLISDLKKPGGYLISGSWSEKAYSEAKNLASAVELGSSKQENFRVLPTLNSLPKDLSYVHFTSNNTIFGTQYQQEPEVDEVPLVCDASSDILSRPLDINKYGLIYAGAQKNLGPAGVTVVVIRNDLLDRSTKTSKIPTMLDYETFTKHDSCYNTPPVYAIYCCGLVFKWLEDLGGLEEMAAKNEEKADLLYNFIDNSELFIPFADKSCRSRMNVTFTMKDKDLEKLFAVESKAQGLIGLEGHRSVGGFRASIYNAMPLQGVAKLVDMMRDFEKRSTVLDSK